MKKLISIILLMVFVVNIITGCADKELNSDSVNIISHSKMRDDIMVQFDEINIKLDKRDKVNVDLELGLLIMAYDDTYKDRLSKPTFSLIKRWDKLSYINSLYNSDSDKYSFCAPLVAIYEEIGKTNLTEDDIKRIKNKILYALDYYYIDQTTTISIT